MLYNFDLKLEPVTTLFLSHPLQTAEVLPYFQKEMIQFKHSNGGIFIPSTSQKPSTTNVFTSTVDPTITPKVMEKKVIKDSF